MASTREYFGFKSISGSYLVIFTWIIVTAIKVPASYIEQARSISKYLVEDTAGQLGLESKLVSQ
jgi:hypothetical protein